MNTLILCGLYDICLCMLFLSTGLLLRLNGLNKKVEKIQESTNKIGNQLNDSLLTLRVLPNSK